MAHTVRLQWRFDQQNRGARTCNTHVPVLVYDNCDRGEAQGVARIQGGGDNLEGHHPRTGQSCGVQPMELDSDTQPRRPKTSQVVEGQDCANDKNTSLRTRIDTWFAANLSIGIAL